MTTTPHLPRAFLELMEASPLATKRLMLAALTEAITKEETPSAVPIEDLVVHVNDLNIDTVHAAALSADIESLVSTAAQ